MNLLAIDSASSILSVAVSCKDKIFCKEINENTRISESAMQVIDSVIKEAGLKPSNLNGVICMAGPGSFTGLRIGYSIAKGLALSLSIPFAAVKTIKEIKKDGANYFYVQNNKIVKCGFSKELLEIGKNIDFSLNSALLSGPEYMKEPV